MNRILFALVTLAPLAASANGLVAMPAPRAQVRTILKENGYLGAKSGQTFRTEKTKGGLFVAVMGHAGSVGNSQRVVLSTGMFKIQQTSEGKNVTLKGHMDDRSYAYGAAK